VIVGGATKKMPFTKQMAEQLAWQVLNLNPASVLVTTSRRTPAEVVETLKQIFPKEKTYFYQYGDAGENPYFGLLAFANRLVVTGDSMSMCSEACATGVPVYIFAPKGSMGKKHTLFHSALYASGYATALGSGQTAFGGRLNEATAVADRIKSMFEV
jgi:mitochondrial fission protein ELM1